MMQRPEDIEQRVREFKQDSFINACLRRIGHIIECSSPTLTYNKEDGKFTFDIDEQSKKEIAKWKGWMEEYIEIKYPEFITHAETIHTT